jgi:hypothetical protein
VGLLDGGLAKSVYEGFRGKLLPGSLIKTAAPVGAALDSHGDPVSTGAVTVLVEGFSEHYSAFVRATAGIPATDLKLNLFGAPLSAAGVVPFKGDVCSLTRNGVPTWYLITGKCEVDPAGALWVCQAAETKAPA